MSCIRFTTPAQKAQLARIAPRMRSADELAAQHPAPPVTASKIRRLRLLARHADPKIRESVASSRHTPADVAAALASDPDEGVRAWLARNETTSGDLLRTLGRDASATVRAWVAVNVHAPADLIAELAADPDDTVRALVAWRAATAETPVVPLSVPV
ncbi:MAG: hypothetical protein HY996_10830 [Micrococcales bacterium]|nr:hypothetical protein [Micrococcales bacterium]